MQIYLVGGAVRDQLLGLPVNERDWVVVGATPEALIQQGYKPVGNDFPVFLHPQTGEEYALARTERKLGRGYRGFEFYAEPTVTLEDDLARRDLTINAMAQADDGTLIDPYHGQADLQRRILRHVSPAFVEDPVRILRVARFVARFEAHGFALAPETQQLMATMVTDGEVDHLVPDRVWQELDRALLEEHPECFIHVLRDCGALAVLFPELDDLFGVPNPAQWHPEVDTGVHTLMVLQQAVALSSERRVRFAALLHDVGKGVTPKDILPHHPDHGAHGVALIQAMCRRYPVPKAYRELAILVSRWHIQSHRCQHLTAEELLDLLEQLDAVRRPQRFAEFLLACEADVRGRTHHENDVYAAGQFLQEALTAIQAVDTAEIVATVADDVLIKQQLRAARLAQLTHLVTSRE